MIVSRDSSFEQSIKKYIKTCSRGHAGNDTVAIQTPSPFAPEVAPFSWCHTILQGQNESKKQQQKKAFSRVDCILTY